MIRDLQERERQTRYPRHARDGVLIICVMVCLLVVSSIIAAATHSALVHRRGMRLEHQMRQTDLLLDAGILRAAQQIAASDDYTGETWRLNEDNIGYPSPLVEIEVTQRNNPGAREITVVAQLGSPLSDVKQSNVSQTRRSHVFTVSIAATESSPSASDNPDSSSVE